MDELYTLEEYQKQAFRNVMNTSRTVKGVVDVSASDTKADAMQLLDGSSAKDIALRNYLDAVCFVYENRDISFDTASSLQDFILTIGKIINKGILKEGYLLRRPGRVNPEFHYEDAEKLEEAFYLVCERFLAYVHESKDPVYLAAYLEYYLNMKLHLFADGCGKSSKIAAAFILMRNRLPLPVYRTNEEYYRYAPTFAGKYFSVEDNEEFEGFVSYYRTLF